jgi:hypothetical protein
MVGRLTFNMADSFTSVSLSPGLIEPETMPLRISFITASRRETDATGDRPPTPPDRGAKPFKPADEVASFMMLRLTPSSPQHLR